MAVHVKVFESPLQEMAKISNRTNFVFKATLSVLFLAVILYHIDLQKIYFRLTTVNLFFVFLTILFNAIGVFVSVLKWDLFLSAQKILQSFRRLHALYYIGFFFNNFLPSMVGGDFVRVLNTSHEKGFAKALSAVLCERTVGLITMCSLAGVAAIYNLNRDVPAVIGWLAFFFLLVIVIGLVIACVLVLVLRLKPPNGRYTRPLAIHLSRIYDAMVQSIRFPRVLIKTLLLSTIFHVLLVLNGYFFARSIGLDLDLMILAVIFPVAILAAMIPISLNGLGIKEGSLILLLGQIGVTTEDALIIAFLSRLFIIVGSGIGWVLFLLQKENILIGSVSGRSYRRSSTECSFKSRVTSVNKQETN